MSGEGEGPRVRKRTSVGAGGTGGVMSQSAAGEDSKRTTRAASKRAAIDDAARAAFPAAGVQQAKKRAALANLSNHSSLPSSRNSSPVSDVIAKKRAALVNLSNHSNIHAARSSVPGSKAGGAGQTGATKSKVAGASFQTRNADVEPVSTQKREKVVAVEKSEKSFLGPAQITIDSRENQENVPPSRGQVDASLKGPSGRTEIDSDIKVPSSRVDADATIKVPSGSRPETDVEVKVSNVSTLPLTESQNSGAKSDAAVIASLERKTLENLYISSRSTKVASSHDIDWPGSQSFTDIDSDHSDPQMCSTYAKDIYNHLRVQEVKRRPTAEFMEALQQDINASMRGILIDWLVEVAEEYKLVPDTLYLTVSYIDRFLSSNIVNRQRLQLLGVSCMLIAAKYEEICAPQVEEFCYITDNTYAREEVLEMERRVLTNLHFELTTPTTKSFLRRFIRAAQAGHSVSALQVEFLGNYLAELTLVEYNFLHYLPSVVAASAVFVARLTLDGDISPWDRTLQHYTGYKASDLKTCAKEIHELQCNTRKCTLPAIREKYSQHKFKCVATLTPVSEIPQEYFEDLEG